MVKKIIILFGLVFVNNTYADVRGLVCSDNSGFNLFYLIDVEREKVSYTNQLQQKWSSTKFIESTLTKLRWKEGSIPVWTVNLHRQTLIMKKTESRGSNSEFQCSVHSSDETIAEHEQATEEQKKKNKI